MTDRLDVLAQREKLTAALRLEGIADPGRRRIVDAMFPLPPTEPQSITGPSGTVYKLQPFQNLSDEKWASLVANCSCLNIRVSDRAHVGALLLPGGVPGVVRAFVEEVLPVTERGGNLYAGGCYYRWDTLHDVAAERLDSILSRLSQKAGEP